MSGDLIDRLRVAATRNYREQVGGRRTDVLTCSAWTEKDRGRRVGTSWCRTDDGEGHRCRFYAHMRPDSRCQCMCGRKWRRGDRG